MELNGENSSHAILSMGSCESKSYLNGLTHTLLALCKNIASQNQAVYNVWSPWSKTLLSMAWMASLGPKLFKRPVLQGILIGTSREVLTFRPWQVGSANGPMGDIYIYTVYVNGMFINK